MVECVVDGYITDLLMCKVYQDVIYLLQRQRTILVLSFQS